MAGSRWAEHCPVARCPDTGSCASQRQALPVMALMIAAPKCRITGDFGWLRMPGALDGRGVIALVR